MYIVFVAIVAGVLLGLTWLYVEHGMTLFLMGTGAVIFCAILNERRGVVYTGSEGWPGAFGSDQPIIISPPPGKNALARPGAAQIRYTQRRALPGPKK
jgi:hypothetical protein